MGTEGYDSTLSGRGLLQIEAKHVGKVEAGVKELN